MAYNRRNGIDKQEQIKRPADNLAAADDGNFLASERDVERFDEFVGGHRGARREVRLAVNQVAHTRGGHSLDVLVGGDGGLRLHRVDAFGQRELDDDSVDAFVAVQFPDVRQESFLRCVVGQFFQRVFDAEFFAGALLVSDVNARGRVLADLDRDEMRLGVFRLQCLDIAFQFGKDFFGECFSIDNFGRHRLFLSGRNSYPIRVARGREMPGERKRPSQDVKYASGFDGRIVKILT